MREKKEMKNETATTTFTCSHTTNSHDSICDKCLNIITTNSMNKDKIEQIRDWEKQLWNLTEAEQLGNVIVSRTPLCFEVAKGFIIKLLEEQKQEIREIFNRCKTEKGLSRALANYLKK